MITLIISILIPPAMFNRCNLLISLFFLRFSLVCYGIHDIVVMIILFVVFLNVHGGSNFQNLTSNFPGRSDPHCLGGAEANLG